MITKAASDCTHPENRIDYRWSHGMAGRCLDCGAVNNGGEWDDFVANASAIEALLIIERDNKELQPRLENYREAAKYNRQYMRTADKQDGVGYQEIVNATVADLISQKP